MTRVRIGNFPPKSEAVLTVYFYQHLEVDDFSFKLTLPKAYIPEYLGDIFAYFDNGSKTKAKGSS